MREASGPTLPNSAAPGSALHGAVRPRPASVSRAITPDRRVQAAGYCHAQMGISIVHARRTPEHGVRLTSNVDVPTKRGAVARVPRAAAVCSPTL